MGNLAETLPSLILDLDIDFAMKQFNKKQYYTFLEKYSEVNATALEDLKAVLSKEDWETELRAAADKLAGDTASFVKRKFILFRKKTELDLVYGLVCIVFPAILDLSETCPNAKEACEIIRDSWIAVFPQNEGIGIASKEEIQSGFKLRIFGIPVGE